MPETNTRPPLLAAAHTTRSLGSIGLMRIDGSVTAGSPVSRRDQAERLVVSCTRPSLVDATTVLGYPVATARLRITPLPPVRSPLIAVHSAPSRVVRHTR